MRLVLASLPALGACGYLRSVLAPGRPDNVVLLVVDTLRADHLSSYGYARTTSPMLDRLTVSAVVFEQARSQAACTFPSVNSLLTSRQVTAFLGQGYANFTIPPAIPTVAEVLHARGWRTFAASASGIVRATPSKVNEHGDVKHCRKVYDTVTHTPLVAWIPGTRGQRVTRPVENLAIVPTILDYLGVETAGFTFDGRSLRATIDGAAPDGPEYAYSSQTALRSVVDGRYKLIVDVVTGRAQLFDLAADPAEQHDLAGEPIAERARLAHALDTRLLAYEGPDGAIRNAQLGENVQRSLHALGYVQ